MAIVESATPKITASGGAWVKDAESNKESYLRITAFDDERCILSFEGTVSASIHCTIAEAREYALEIVGATRKGGIE